MEGDRYVLVQCDQGSSVYSALVHALQQRPEWRCGGNPAHPTTGTNLILADRNKLPFNKMGLCRGMKQHINYYRGSAAVCRKAALARLIKEHCRLNNTNLFPWFLPSYIIYPRALTEPTPDTSVLQRHKMAAVRRRDEREAFLQAWQRCQDEGEGQVWIAKATTGAKGEGILISADPHTLIAFVDEQTTAHVLQKYIQNPLLLDGRRKFDIRVWVILDHNYSIHVFREGVLRTASDPYDPSDFNHVTSHLTNHCLQEALSPNYGKYEKGNEMFFQEFDRYLKDNHALSLEKDILPQIHDIIKETLYMIKEELVTDQLDYTCFQLFGFDFLLDEKGHVSLLEVNGSPACAEKLLPSLVQCLLAAAVDSIFSSEQSKMDASNLIKLI